MTDEERWKVINAVEPGDLMAAMKAVGTACQSALDSGAPIDDVRLLSIALRKQFVEAWAEPRAAPPKETP